MQPVDHFIKYFFSEIITCIENKQEVLSVMEEPGRVYSGPRREELASLKITSLFKAQLGKLRPLMGKSALVL